MIPLNSTVPTGQNAFDSHLCYAAPPVHTSDGERLYYMGSNGPHTGSKPRRNASLGLAHLRTDGYAGISGQGVLTTVPLVVAGPILTLTLDILSASAIGSVKVGVSTDEGARPVPGLSVADCIAITANATNAEVRFNGGADFGRLIGHNVTLEIVITDAIVYTIGWAT